jgi:hypothetical protein
VRKGSGELIFGNTKQIYNWNPKKTQKIYSKNPKTDAAEVEGITQQEIKLTK